ncbi:MAG: photosynthetic reaction center subunit H [Gemmatimonadaceae bacterium]
MTDMMKRSPGAPLEPIGNPMLSNMGPAAYSNRPDRPDLTLEGIARIVPLRAAPGFHLDEGGPDPRGMTVVGGDNEIAGTVTDVWVDRAEPCTRFYEVALSDSTRTVLLPTPCTRIKTRTREVMVKSIFGRQFADVPAIANPDRVTLLEEDRIMAYYASGYMYASPERSEPFF